MSAIRRDGRYYYRKSEGCDAVGDTRWLLLAGPDDTTSEHHGYAPSCPSCWLGYGHTVAAHGAAS